jgi:tagatose-1,6-bisphosphate aldolase non-catalytic subunit AgaZ/GatZ
MTRDRSSPISGGSSHVGNRHPQIGIGPMSRNLVDACLRVAARRRSPIMLIASRRQIESAVMGGGYVEGWDTRTFAEYVRARDPGRLLWLCRDHGGPWQHPSEAAMGELDAMESSRLSFLDDIEAGFDLLHIDTSAEGKGVAEPAAALERLAILYEQCVQAAFELNRQVCFEIGFEDQSTEAGDPAEFSQQVAAVLASLGRARLPHPRFIVAQTATKVIEDRNVGAVTEPLRRRGALRTVGELSALCHLHHVRLKAHNCDYLSEATLRQLVEVGVDAMNIAPELGVEESRALLNVLHEVGLRRQAERFLEVARQSGAWRKWLAPNTALDDAGRALLAGHYVFASDVVRGIQRDAARACSARGFTLEQALQAPLEMAIERFLDAFDRSDRRVAAARVSA